MTCKLFVGRYVTVVGSDVDKLPRAELLCLSLSKLLQAIFKFRLYQLILLIINNPLSVYKLRCEVLYI